MSAEPAVDFVLCSESPYKATAYIEALKLAGVPAERIFAISPADDSLDAQSLRELGANARGLLLCGGPDVEPERYGETARPDANLCTMPELDAIEWELLLGAQDANTPVLGVCRGMQLLNVFLGGTLYQDVPSELGTDLEHDFAEPEDFLAHKVQVTRQDLPFGQVFGDQAFEVNTRHHQSVKSLATDLEAVAFAPDGVLEVCQSVPSSWWRWAVQWHPENLVAHEIHQRIWHAFVAKAAGPVVDEPVEVAMSAC